MEGGGPVMSSIDERIVKMKFDNRQFEDGVKETMGSLSQLEQSLKLEGIRDSVDQIGDKISMLGVVGATVVNQITTSLLETGKNFINSVLDPILEGGKKRALNMEHALFMFKGLGIDETIALDNANTAVLGTAYSLDAAAKAAAMLAASGQKLGDPMTQSLRAIAGVAAMANAPFEDMAHIFTTVASNGKLMTQQIRQFSFRGLNIAAVLAKQLGVSEARVMEMTTAGEISWERFYTSIYKEYGDFAAKANETFEGAAANLRAAWARIGAPFFTVLHESKRDVANAFRPVVNEINASLTPIRDLFTNWMGYKTDRKIKWLENLDLSNLQQFIKILANLGKAGLELKKAFDKAWDKVFPRKKEKEAAGWLVAIRRFTQDLIPLREQALKIEKFFRGVLSIFGLAFDLIKTVFRAVGSILKPIFELFGIVGKAAKSTGGNILDFLAWIGDLIYRFREWLNESELLIKITDGLESAVRFLVNIVKSLFNFIGNLTPIRKLREGIASLGPTIRNWMFSLRNSEPVKQFLGYIREAGPKTREWFESFKKSAFVQTATSNIRDFAERTRSWLSSLKDTKIYQKASDGVRTMTDRLKDWWVQVRSGEAFQKFKTSASSAFSNVKQRITDFINSPQFKDFTAKTKETFGKVIDWVVDKYNDARDAVVKFFQDIRDETGKIDFNKVKEAIKTFFSNLLNTLKSSRKNVKETIFGIFGSMKDGFNSAAAGAGTIAEKLMGGVKGLFDYLSHLNITDITKLIGSIIGLKAISALKDLLLKPLADIGLNISSIFKNVGEGIKDFSKGMEKNLKAKALNERAKALLNFALAIGVIAASLWVIAQIPTEDLKRAGITVGIIAAAMAGIFVITTLMKTKLAEAQASGPAKKGGLFNISPIVQVVGALTAAIAAIKSLATLNTEGLLPKVLILLGVVAAFVLLARFLGGGTAGKSVSSTVTKVLPDKFKQIATSITGDEATSTIGQVTQLLALAQAVKMLVSAIKAMTKVNIEGSEAKIIGMMAIIAGFMAMTRLAGKNATKGGVALIAIAASIWLFVTVFKKIAAIKDSELNKGLAVMTSLMLGISIFLASTRLTGKDADKSAKSLVSVGIAVTLLSVAIVMLSKLDPKQMVPALLAVDSLLVIIGMLLLVASKAEGSYKTVYAVTTMAVLLAASIAALSVIDPERLIPAALAIDLTIAMMAVLIKAADDAKTAEATLVLMLAFVGGVALILYGLTEMPEVDKALLVATALSEVLLAASAAAFIASKIDLAAATKGALAIDAVIILVGGLFTLLGVIDEWVGKDFNLIGKIEKGIEIVTTITNGIGQMIGAFIGGIGEGLTASLPNMADHLTTFMNKLQPFFKHVQNIPSNLGEKTGQMAAAIMTLMAVEFIDAAKNFMTFFTGGRTLTEIGDELVSFAPRLVNFSNQLKGLNYSQMSSAAEVMKGFGMLLSALPSEGGIMESIFGKKESLSAFSDGMVAIADAIIKFQDKLKGGVNIKLAEDAAAAGKTLAELESSLPSHGGILKEWFAGDASLVSFGRQLEYFAQGIVDFQAKFEGVTVDLELAKTAAAAGEALAALEKSLPSHGGIWKEWFAGDANLVTFGRELSYFAEGLVNFQTVLKEGGGVDVDLATDAGNAGLALSALEKSLPSHGGIWKSWFAGDADLQTFGMSLVVFAHAIVKFQDVIKAGGGINEKVVESAANAGRLMKELEETLPPHGGVVSLWSGDNSLGQFAGEMVVFGQGLKMFADRVGNISEGDLTGALSATDELVQIANKLEGSRGGLKSIWSQEYNFKVLGEQLISLGSGLASFSNSIGGSSFNSDVISHVLPALERLIEIAKGTSQLSTSSMSLFIADLKRVGDQAISGFTEVFTGADGRIKAAVTSLFTNIVSESRAKTAELKAALYTVTKSGLDRIIDAFVEFRSGITFKNAVRAIVTSIRDYLSEDHTRLKTAGETLMINLIRGIQVQVYYVKTAVSTPVSQALAELSKMKAEFKTSGENAAQGFIDGLKAKKPAAKTAGRDIGKEALKGANEGLKISSPSKEFFKTGIFAVEGFIGALEAGLRKARTAGQDVGESSLFGLENALALIKHLLTSDLKSPVITPILNLDDIYSGLGAMNAILGGKTYTNNLAYQTSGTMKGISTKPVAQQLELMFGQMQKPTTQYDIAIKVEGDGLSPDKIREIAVGVEKEIKAMDDRLRFSRGEAVSFA